MKFLTYLMTSLCFILILNSCFKENKVDDIKLSFDSFETKNQILALSKEEQKQFWIGRLETYSALNLSQNQKNIISKMIENLKDLEKGRFFVSEGLKENAIQMVKITPKDDFLSLFVDYAPIQNVSNTGKICEACLTDLGNYKIKRSNDLNQTTSATIRDNPDCNCNWACSEPIEPCETLLSACTSGDQVDCCNETSGCGLFLLGTCDGAVVSTGDC